MTRYRIPTHLTVEPSLVRAEVGPLPVDLTFRQAAILACAAGFAYWVWQGSGLPLPVAIGLALATVAIALVAAFVAVGGRSADLWLRDALHYAVRPRRLVWLAEEQAPADDGSTVAWVNVPLRLVWSPGIQASAPAPSHLTAD